MRRTVPLALGLSFVLGLTLAVQPVDAAAQITEIIDTTGDGGGNPLDGSRGVAVDSGGNVFVVGSSSRNVFKIAPGGATTEIIDITGFAIKKFVCELLGSNVSEILVSSFAAVKAIVVFNLHDMI